MDRSDVLAEDVGGSLAVVPLRRVSRAVLALTPHGVLLITHLLEVTIDVGWRRHCRVMRMGRGCGEYERRKKVYVGWFTG
jgi:hypothetical protein